jgi:hypothetical protein
MPEYKLKELKPAKDKKHKFVATLENKETKREKNVKFGAYGMSDFTKHKDDDRKKDMKKDTKEWVKIGLIQAQRVSGARIFYGIRKQ